MHDLDETLEAFEASEPEELFDSELEEEDEAYPLGMESPFDELEALELETSPLRRRSSAAPGLGRRSGRWVRRGNRIVLLGV